MRQAAEERNSLTRVLHFAEYNKKSSCTTEVLLFKHLYIVHACCGSILIYLQAAQRTTNSILSFVSNLYCISIKSQTVFQ